MGFNNKYPYTDFHELNLDWFLAEFQKVTTKVDTLEQTVQDFIDYVNHYFEDLDLQHEVTLRLNAMAADGTLAALIQPLFDSYKGEIDNIVIQQNNKIDSQDASIAAQNVRLSTLETQMDTFASLPPGSTAGNTELLDIRLEGNGITLSTAGDAVRHQINTLAWFNAQMLYEGSDVRNGTTINGLTLANNGGGRLHISGLCSGSSSFTLCNTGGNNLPAAFLPGKDVYLYFNTPGSNFTEVRLFTCNNALAQNWALKKIFSPADKIQLYTLPADCEGVLIWLPYTSGVNYNDDVTFFVLNAAPNMKAPENLVTETMDELTETDLNNVLDNNWHLLTSNYVYTNKPAGYVNNTGFLRCIRFNSWNYQQLFNFNNAEAYCRRGNSDGTSWTAWALMSGGKTINYNTNSYAVTATPTITTDQNNYLASSNNTNDRTADIASLLATGACNLGPGEFYVHDLEMPANSILRGCGKATKIVLSAGDGYAVKLNSGCTLENLFIDGSATDIALDGDVQNRDAILWMGTDSLDGQAPAKAFVSKVFVHGFKGCALRCYDTGTPNARGLSASELYAYNCECGIKTEFSEYNRFENAKIHNCYYGSLNDGGNNMFIGCDFSGCTVGFRINDSNGIYGNNGHGSCVACQFNHIDNNTGIALDLNEVHHGFTFTACQIFFGAIRIVNSKGIIVADSVLGDSGVDITIIGGKVVQFANNSFQGTPTITITGNTDVHFSGNYNRNTGAIVQ